MFSTFFKFELRAWLRAPLPWIFLLVFGMMTFPATISDDVSIGGSYGNVWKNAPFVAQNWYAVFSIISLLLATAFFNTAAIRDYENNTSQIIFASPISKSGYYFGHFAGALLAALIPMLGVSIGMWLGAAMNSVFEWMDTGRFGPFEVMGHIQGFLVFTLPNMIFAGGILYAVATLTRSTLYSFIAATVLLVGYIVAGNIIRDLENEGTAVLLDPFGFYPFSAATKYWTIDEKNHLALSVLHPKILTNRLIWVGVGIAVLILGYFKFDFSEKMRRRTKSAAREDESPVGLRELGETKRVQPESGMGVTIRQLMSQLRTDFKGVVKSTPFILLSIIGLLNCIPNLRFASDTYGTTNFPVTYDIIDTIRGSFYLFCIAILTYFTGALVWKERTAKVNEIFDALPTKNWTSWVSKFLTIVSAIFLLNLIVIVAGIVTQFLMDYHRYEIGVYIRELLILDLLGFAFLAALFLLIHALTPNMYLGFFISIVVVMVNGFVWEVLNVSSNMVKLGDMPDYIISDFYGYKPFAEALAWFHIYWMLFAGLLGTAAICFWPRGKESGWRKRLSLAGQEWKKYRAAGLILLGVWLTTAGFVYYNTKVINKFQTSKEQENLQARYEKDYKKFQDFPQPRVRSVNFRIDIFPEKRAYETSARMWVHNPHAHPIDTLLLQVPNNGKFTLLNERLNLLINDSAVYFRIYRIQPALAAGDSMLLEFTTNYHAKGFENQLSNQSITQNGTFFNNTDISPFMGYQEGNELADKNTRKEYGLPEKTRLPALNPADTFARRNQYLTNDSDWVTVETQISTSEDQTAIAPGSLVREWKEGGRRYFQYKLDHKAWNFYSFMSARYEIAREEKGGITYEVYYHKEHAVNVPRMLKSMQKSLEYFTTNFGPYYHKQCRIIEFPRYASFAQAFPGTMPYSENIGFIENFNIEKDDIDMVFYVVAHEMGHQYWAHQECGAAMQGSEITTETFAQYSALMVMEKEYGRDIMRKFLEYETDRYLRGRSRETQKEMPLGKCERQGYIHYNKGSAVMYYLKEMIGEENVNIALRSFLEKYRYKDAPYPTSADPVAAFEAQTPDSLKYIIQDLFWDITLFENRTREARVKDLGNGRWEVTLDVECRKLKADDQGKESEVPVNDWIEIGAFAKPEGEKKYGKTLHRQRVKISQKDNTFTFVVDEKPYTAGVDPFALLIDREPKDNSKKVE